MPYRAARLIQKQLQIQHPIIQAPMAGGATTPELVAAVSNLGSLGSLGAGYMTPEVIQEYITDIRALTDKPYQANVFVATQPNVSEPAMQLACDTVRSVSRELDYHIDPPSPPYLPNLEQQIETLLRLKTPIISFTFGIPDQSIVTECKKQNRVVIGTATHLEEAQAWQDQQVDAICLQGCEAGGHRGTFLQDPLQSLIPLQNLLANCIKKIKAPLIVSGGIYCGQQVQQYLQAGAAAAQIGTAFLCTPEAGIPDIYKQCIAAQTTDSTVLTKAFSGKYARGINNGFITRMEAHQDTILPYPAQNKISKQMRNAAKAENNKAFMSLWAGQSVAQTKYQSTASLFAALTAEL